MKKVEDQLKKAEEQFSERDDELEARRRQIAESQEYIGEYKERLKVLRAEISSKENALTDLQKEQNQFLDKIEPGNNDEDLSHGFLQMSKKGHQLGKEVKALQNEEQKCLGIILGNTLFMERAINHINGLMHEWMNSGRKVVRFMKIFTEKAGYVDKSKIDTYVREDTSVKIVKSTQKKPRLSNVVREEAGSNQADGMTQNQVVSQRQDTTDLWGSDEEAIDELLVSVTEEINITDAHGDQSTEDNDRNISPSNVGDGTDDEATFDELLVSLTEEINGDQSTQDFNEDVTLNNTGHGTQEDEAVSLEQNEDNGNDINVPTSPLHDANRDGNADSEVDESVLDGE